MFVCAYKQPVTELIGLVIIQIQSVGNSLPTDVISK